MCEPAHSVIQYPDRPSNEDDENMPFSGSMDWRQRLQVGLGSLGTRIGNWFHFSKIGKGHSEALHVSARTRLLLPEHTKLEGFWWDRSFDIDGPFYGDPTERAAGIQAAKVYHERSVLANHKVFRNFLEKSIKASDRPEGYVDHLLCDVFTLEGRDKVLQKFRQVFGRTSRVVDQFYRQASGEFKSRATGVLMGFTRKRNLFRSHFADDLKFWTLDQGDAGTPAT